MMTAQGMAIARSARNIIITEKKKPAVENEKW
jgi:hypothetical protein